MILVVQTNTFAVHGGIPTYNRLVCRALEEMSCSCESRVLIGIDRADDIDQAASRFPNVRLEGFGGNRLRLISRLIRLALSRRLDLVLLGHVNYAPLGWMLKQLQPKLRYGVVLYGIEAWQRITAIRRRALQNADFLISISDYTRQKAVEINHLDADRIYLLHNALEWEDIDASAITTTALPIGTRLLSVCRLDRNEQYKGVDKVIEALPEVIKSVPDVQYLVVGGGTDLERHKLLAERMGVGKHVHFLGVLESETLRTCYHDSDVFVMPSSGEGFGFVFLEAMLYSKPVIAAKCTAVPEVVADGVAGLLVERENPAQLAGAIMRLCRDKTLRQRMGKEGQERLRQNFMFAQFKENFREILIRELPEKTLADDRSTVVDGPSVI